MGNETYTGDTVAELEALAKYSAYQVVLEARTSPVEASTYALGHTTCAVLAIEGPEAGHAFAAETLDALNLQPGDAFDIWVDLYHKGDPNARHKAYHMLEVALNDEMLLGTMAISGMYPLDIAEKLIQLVEAGDTNPIELARDLASQAPLYNAVPLLSRLYIQDDAASLEPAITAVGEAQDYFERTAAEGIDRTETALVEMAAYAASNFKVADTLRLIDYIHEPPQLAYIHALLYAHCLRKDSLDYAHCYLLLSESADRKAKIEEVLAIAGHQPTIEAIRHRVATSETGLVRPVYCQLRDYEILHRTGDATAARQVTELVRHNPRRYLCYLGRVGLHEEQAALALELFQANPDNMETTQVLLNHQFQLDHWQKVFRHALYKARNPAKAGSLLGLLARHIDQVRED